MIQIFDDIGYNLYIYRNDTPYDIWLVFFWSLDLPLTADCHCLYHQLKTQIAVDEVT